MKISNPEIIILTRDPNLWSCQQFKQTCDAQGQSLLFLNPFSELSTKIWELRPKVVLHRSSGVLFDDVDILLCQYWQAHGARIYNPPNATEIFRDKSKAYLYLKSQGFPQIPTFLIRGSFSFEDKIFNHGVVIKPNRGNKGIGVQIFDQRHEAKAFWSTLSTDQRYLIQPKISPFRDLRIFVLNGELLSSFYKDQPDNQPTIPSIVDLTIQYSKKLGLKYAAWDWVETTEGWLLNEVNLSPGFQKLRLVDQEKLTKMLTQVTLTH